MALRVFLGPIIMCLPNQAEQFGSESVDTGETETGLGRGVTILYSLKAQFAHMHWRKDQVPFGGAASRHLQERCPSWDIPVT